MWNDDLAEIAQSHADLCVFRHNGERLSQQSVATFTSVGENLYAGSRNPISYEAAVQAWYDEVVDFAYDTRACRPGKQCGHYTQVSIIECSAVNFSMESTKLHSFNRILHH